MASQDSVPYSEKDLVERLAVGDEQAFTHLYSRYSPAIFNSAMFYVKDVEMSKEIVQQVFVRIWEKRSMLSQVENFKSYLFSVGRNYIFDFFRKRNNETKALLVLAEKERFNHHEGHSEISGREYARILQAAIEQLPAQQRKIYEMINMQGSQLKVVASELGLSKFTIKRHLELARQFVRNYVSKRMSIVFFVLYMSKFL